MNGRVIGIVCPVHKQFFSGEYCPLCPKEKLSGLTVIPDIQPFVTEHITGKPVEVRSRRHRRVLLRDNRLVEYDKNSSSKNRQEFERDNNFDWR